jgi:hypothetical protein
LRGLAEKFNWVWRESIARASQLPAIGQEAKTGNTQERPRSRPISDRGKCRDLREIFFFTRKPILFII